MGVGAIVELQDGTQAGGRGRACRLVEHGNLLLGEKGLDVGLGESAQGRALLVRRGGAIERVRLGLRLCRSAVRGFCRLRNRVLLGPLGLFALCTLLGLGGRSGLDRLGTGLERHGGCRGTRVGRSGGRSGVGSQRLFRRFPLLVLLLLLLFVFVFVLSVLLGLLVLFLLFLLVLVLVLLVLVLPVLVLLVLVPLVLLALLLFRLVVVCRYVGLRLLGEARGLLLAFVAAVLRADRHVC
ncbi:hypothetical protein VTK73DRAFT_164 [Phialemonium thermophilum]|uniref:ABC transmembrane type-1 domain-containing protein n=1 Tax=Phialemonium thermophilum TaxID=223376 RepID=A0ABR3VWP2_9PEZI